MKQGMLCISIDTELYWRCSNNNNKYFTEGIKKEKETVGKIIKLLKKYNIPATWAIVGGLFLKVSSGKKNSRLLYAPDLIRKIKNTKGQEIASHSFTHPDFTAISLKKANEEIKNCVDIARKNKINLNSFVFPRNRVNHLQLLKKHGFKSFRSEYLLPSTILKPFWKIFELINFLFLHPHIVTPSNVNGIINIPGTMYYLSTRNLRKLIPIKFRSKKAIVGINLAIKNNKLFHIWFHPLDFVDNSQLMLNSFEDVLKHASKMRDLGKLEIKTMQEIASEFSYLLSKDI